MCTVCVCVSIFVRFKNLPVKSIFGKSLSQTTTRKNQNGTERYSEFSRCVVEWHGDSNMHQKFEIYFSIFHFSFAIPAAQFDWMLKAQPPSYILSMTHSTESWSMMVAMRWLKSVLFIHRVINPFFIHRMMHRHRHWPCFFNRITRNLLCAQRARHSVCF